jgi:hypothetical protein
MSDDQSPDINGIIKSIVMETKNGFLINVLNWFPIFGCTRVKARKMIILAERNPLDKKRLSNMITKMKAIALFLPYFSIGFSIFVLSLLEKTQVFPAK